MGERRNAGFVPLGALRPTLFSWRSTLGVARNLLALERSLQKGLAKNIVERVDYFELPARLGLTDVDVFRQMVILLRGNGPSRAVESDP